ncbi:Glycerophosphoryl diester phosphodiesterase family-domain-containing protein [Chaetomium tenue]|uniref:Glycerophosphoryl diester phosphodiesterase family-domain-containing protein n=1 Tax=Chaetomium tenue TaxID=1854479 RepID=A0ACB7PFP4_9PEZI|nr:Glycerophosphoryl diester phosphodiesterase family-domain-containing protein [Chaetomium globosum]
MRFGRDLHQHRVPAWVESYVSYERVKLLVRAGDEKDGFNAFSARQVAVIHSRIADLEDRYGVSITKARPPASELSQVVVPELEDLQSSLGDIQAVIVQLDWYNRVNQEAIQRLRHKRQRVAGTPPPQSRSSAAEAAKLWNSEPLASLNQFRVAIRTALAVGGPAPTTSLLSQRWLHKRGVDIPDTARRAVAIDDSAALGQLLHQVRPDEDRALLARALLQLATVYGALGCCALLTPLSAGRLAHGKEDADFLHHLVVEIGRRRDGDSSKELDQITRALPESERWVLLHADAVGRLALHYAAAYGLVGAIFTTDAAGETPLDLAVGRGHAATVRTLLEAAVEDIKGDRPEEAVVPQHLGNGSVPLGRLLLAAIQAGSEDVFSILLSTGLRLHEFQNDNGETAMYVAARHGRVEMVRALLLTAVDPNSAESGHQEVFELLVNAGVDQDVRDYDRGWTALDHAAYKGYPAMMKMLRRQPKLGFESEPGGDGLPGNRILSTSVPRLDIDNLPPSASSPRPSNPQSYVFIHPGTLDVYDKVAAVDISPYQAKIAPAVAPDSSLFLEISSLEPPQQQTPAPPCVSQLPILDDWSNRPWGFATQDATNAKVVFRVFSALANEDDGLIGTAIALLSSLRRVLGPGRESLIRHRTIPLLGRLGDFVGTVTFTFMVAHARGTLRPPPTAPQRLERPRSTLIGAHRGLGQNGKQHTNLQMGENTLQFDVQVTKDYVPVIYHDFLVAESGTDIGMHEVTFEQFMAISDAQSGDGAAPPSSLLPPRLPWDEAARPRPQQRRRAGSLHAPRDDVSKALVDRMRHTFDHHDHGFKPNVRGKHIHAPFVTLKELLLKLPADVPFDVELKYPMLSEANDFTMDVFGMEINTFLDCILDVIHEFGGDRPIVFTSFSPEVCMALAMKQQTYPILFLNESCTAKWPTHDIRAISVQTAIHFARGLGINGVVMASDPFVVSPKLVRKVQNRGLICWSFGNMNDDPDNALIQAEAGLEVIIVNHVRRITETLRQRCKIRESLNMKLPN